MTYDELHRQDVENGVLQTVQAGGKVHVVEPDPETIGRWQTVATYPDMIAAQAYIDGRHDQS